MRLRKSPSFLAKVCYVAIYAMSLLGSIFPRSFLSSKARSTFYPNRTHCPAYAPIRPSNTRRASTASGSVDSAAWLDSKDGKCVEKWGTVCDRCVRISSLFCSKREHSRFLFPPSIPHNISLWTPWLTPTIIILSSGAARK